MTDGEQSNVRLAHAETRISVTEASISMESAARSAMCSDLHVRVSLLEARANRPGPLARFLRRFRRR